MSAKKIKIPRVLLTGGEPIGYKYITDCVEYLSESGIESVISSSGLGLTEDMCYKFKRSNLIEFYISLNGSNAKIHNLSRKKFNESLIAIDLLKKHDIPCGVNWVARDDNVCDFPDLINLCIEKGINNIVVLSNKKHNGIIDSPLGKAEISLLGDYIRSYEDQFNISYELILGTCPDAFLLVVNSDDELKYIERTIKFLESISLGKVIAIAISPINQLDRWSVLGSSIKILSQSDLDIKKKEISENFKVPVFITEEVNSIYNNIIAYFS